MKTDIIKSNNIQEIDQKMLTEITNFKQQTVRYLKTQSARLHLMDVKEVKDLVSIVNTLETSIKPDNKDNITPINVVIQNLINQYNND